MNTDAIQTAVCAINPDVTMEQAIAASQLVDALSERLAELKRLRDEAFMEWIRANGEITVGSVRYYLGTKKVTKCIDPAGTIEALLQTFGGDMARVVEFMSSDPFKYGACRSQLNPATYELLFQTSEVEDLKEGKAGKRLMKVDERFLPQGGGR